MCSSLCSKVKREHNSVCVCVGGGGEGEVEGEWGGGGISWTNAAV